MPHSLRSAVVVRTAILICVALASVRRAEADPIVWTGPTVTFSKVGTASPNLAQNQDRLTDNVWITRGGARSGGIFNRVLETNYNKITDASPLDTEWATDLVGDNGDESIAATNFAALDYTTWAISFGGPSSALMTNILSKNAVVHLITDDIYFDIQFTAFTNSGLVTYERSSAAPVTTGDYNGDGVVDAADYTVWRDALDDPADPPGSGADGDMSGTIDEGDYTFWRNNFGMTFGAGATAAAHLAPGESPGANYTIPEPTAFVLALAGLPLLRMNRMRRLMGR